MIVVGIDGSKESIAALAWAIDEAKRRNTDIRAVHAWTMPAPPGRLGYYAEPLQDPAPYEAGAERFLSDFLAESTKNRNGVPIEGVTVQGSPAEELVRFAKDAELLVVGSRGHGGFGSLVLGSVSHQCAQHASCPVVIVRPRG